MRDRSWKRYLPFERWPMADRQAWATAVAEGDILDGRGPAAHWATATRQSNLRHYGRWLGYLRHTGLLQESCRPEERVTREAVRSYVAHLHEAVAPRTVVSSLVGLKVVMKAMAPQENWRWLADLCNVLNRTCRPRKDKAARMRPSGAIYAAAIGELIRLGQTPLKRRLDRVAYRDILMLALMTARPLRLKNFAGLRIDRHLVAAGNTWLLVIPGEEVKNRQPLEYALPGNLVPFLKVYLDRVRPAFLTGGTSDALWLGFEGGPLTPHSIYGRFRLVSRRLLGVEINPHLLRDCAATSLSRLSAEAARSAAGLLGHRSFATTERYYIQASQLEAGRTLNAMLAQIRKTLR